MGFEYTKKAKDTMYGGCLFRSRLEATWAAFFDICGIKWVYEPFDLPGWSPDFLIAEVIACEVKPYSKPDTELQWKMINAERGVNFQEKHSLLFLGVCPLNDETIGYSVFDEQDYLGINPDGTVDIGPRYPEIQPAVVSLGGRLQSESENQTSWDIDDFCEIWPRKNFITAFNEAKNKVRFTVR